MFQRTAAWNRIRYTIWSPVYNMIARFTRAWRRRSLELLKLHAPQKVLLIGAGTGLDLDYLPPSVHITAIDLTPAMLRRLQARARRQHLVVDARVMDAQKLDFADNSFDAVVLHFIVAVIPDPIACIKEAARVLRPGGRATVLDKFAPDDGPAPTPLRAMNPVMSVLATEVTRQLGPILAESRLRVVTTESLGPRKMVKIAILEKG